jgi:hypothetical protein
VVISIWTVFSQGKIWSRRVKPDDIAGVELSIAARNRAIDHNASGDRQGRSEKIVET